MNHPLPCFAFTLFTAGCLGLAALPVHSALAGQTITINAGDSVVGTVFGNGTPPSGESPYTEGLNSNVVTIESGGTVSGTVYGGYSITNGAVTANSVTVSGEVNGVNGGYSQSGAVTGNSVTIDGGSVNYGGGVYGGYSGYLGGDATGNDVTVKNGGAVSGDAIGGYSQIGSATGNYVTIDTGGAVSGSVYGGYSNSGATGNTVTLDGGTVSGSVYGGYSNSGATGNTVTIGTNQSSPLGVVYGGYGVAGDRFSGNRLYKNSDVAIGSAGRFEFVTFGYSGNAGIATLDTTPLGSTQPGVRMDTQDNTITFDGVISGTGALIKMGDGTLTLSGTNTYTGGTTISGGTLAISADGNLGAANGGVTLDGGTLEFNDGVETSNRNFALTSNNGTIAVNSGEYDIYGNITGAGGLTKTGDGTLTLAGANTYTGATVVKGGTLALSGAGSLASETMSLYDQTTFVNGGTAVLLSSLNVYGSAHWTGNLNMANQTMNFYLPATVSDGNEMLAVSGAAYVGGSQVNVGVSGGSKPLQPGEGVTLIAAAGGLNGTPANTNSTGEGMQGVTLNYQFDLSQDANNLYATVTGVRTTAQSETLIQGFLSGMGLLNQSSDLIAGWGMNAAVDAAMRPNLDSRYGIGVFGAVSGGSTRYDTGSSVDVSGVSVMAGVSKRINVQPGVAVVGAFIEYGNGSYDTYSSFHGDGDLDHVGGGIIGRFDFAGSKIGHFYTEGSARMGSIDNDFGGLYDTFGHEAKFDASSTYYGIHLGSGYVWNLTDKAALDVYARYFWTQQKGDTVRLTTGETVSFDNINSHRMRVGARFAYAVAENISPYAGLAYEHEFDGEARATTNGYSLKAPSIDGGSAVGELGLTLKPSASMPVALDLGVQGYTGTREGVTGTLHLRYDF